jgi:hypothetical protein
MARARRGGRAPALPPERARRGGRAPALPPERARETGDEPPPTSEAPVKERSAVCEHVRLEASRAVFFMRVSTDAEHRDGATRPSRVRDSVRQVRGELRAPRRTSHVQTRRSPRRPLRRGAHHNAASRVRPLGPAGGFACSSKMAASTRCHAHGTGGPRAVVVMRVSSACSSMRFCEHVRLEAVLVMRVSTDAEHRDGATRPSRVRDSVRQVRGESRAPRRTSHVQTRRSPRRPLGRGAHHDGRDGACWVAARTTTVATAPAGSRRATTTERRGLMRVSTDPEPRSAGWVGHEALPPSIAHEGVLDQEVVREEDGEEQGEHERAVAERVDPVRAVRV